MMTRLLSGLLLGCVLSLNTRWVDGQQFGGAHVCKISRERYVEKQKYQETCGWKWGMKQCERTRDVTKYKVVNRPVCCGGWVTGPTDKVNCNLAVCHGRAKHPGTCANRGTCVSPNFCQCTPGFLPPDCSKDVNECDKENGGCSHKCVNSHGSYRCVCPEGFGAVSQTTCLPKCYYQKPGECANGGTCTAPDTCSCQPGYQTKDCQDEDECGKNNGGCSDICLNVPGSYKCACRKGYKLVSDEKFPYDCKPSCFDILPLGSCMNNDTCYEPDRCKCSPGFKLPKCDDLDECHENANDCSQVCVNTIGSYKCDCNPGFKLADDGKTCIATCFGMEKAGECPNSGTCISPDKCLCPEGFGGSKCADEDECAHDVCPGLCENTVGSYRCYCHKDYVKEEDDTCTPVCDNSLEPGECFNGGTCLSPGICDCPKGYEAELCKDTDECAKNNGGCSDTCVNEEGGYHCECPTGYELKDENTCGDFNECESDNSCDKYCVNIYGSYSCQCPSGFKLTSDKRCEDIDECKQSAPCAQHCTNIPGSFVCSCDENFVKTPDGRGCREIQLCGVGDDPSSGCAPLCTGTRPCRCPDNTYRHENRKNCIDPCMFAPCKHNGTCEATWGSSFYCNCHALLYTGEHCERGMIRMASKINARVGVKNTNTIRAYPMQELRFEVSTPNKNVQILPNPVTVRGPTQFSTLVGKRGMYDVTFNIYGQNADVFDNTTSVRITANDVFSRLNLNHSTLPTGCFWYQLQFQQQTLRFSSTSAWYKLDKGNAVFTTGVVMIVHDKIHLPVSSDGVEILSGNKLVLNSVMSSKDSDAQKVDDTSVSCEELILSERDMKEFREARSIFWTLFNNMEQLLPYWMLLLPSEELKTEAIPFKPQVLTGEEVQQQAVCTGAPTSNGVLYLVFRFKDPFIMRILEESFHIREGDCCIVVDMFRPVGATVTFMFTKKASARFQHMDVFKSMKNRAEVTLYFTGFSISNPKAIEIPKSYENIQLWNGANVFKYPFAKTATVWSLMTVKKEFAKSYDSFDFELEATIEAFMAGVDPQSLFTHLFVDPRDVLIAVKNVKLSFGLKLFNRHHAVKMISAFRDRRAIVAIGGDGNRTYCGKNANPPGVFARISMESNFFEGMPIIEDFLFGHEEDVYLFKTFPEGKDKVSVSDKWINHTQHVIGRVKELVTMLKSSVYNVDKSKLKSDSIVQKIEELQNNLNNVSDHLDSVDLDSVTSMGFAEFTRIETEYIAQIHRIYMDIEDRMSLLLDPSLDDMTAVFANNIADLRRRSSVVVFQLYALTLPFFPNKGTLGFKGTFGITILGMHFGIEGELVMTDDKLFKCKTQFSDFYKHLEGENSVRFFGVVTWQTPSVRTLPWGPAIWKYLNPKRGLGVELAFSQDSFKFVARLHVRWNLVGLGVTGDLFVTNNGVFAAVEGNVFNMFRARLTVGANISLKPKDWGIWIRADFLPGPDDSFEGSLWDAVRQAVRRFGESAKRRLQTAENFLAASQKKLSIAQDKVKEAKRKLLQKDYLFDEAIAKLEKAKKKLEDAKAPFLKAKATLTKLQEKLNRMCQIKTCEKRCMWGVKNWKSNKCAFKMPDVKCCLSNVICRVKRGLVYVALSVAKAFIHIPILALDTAKVAVSALQIVVDKSRWLLNVAAAFYDAGRLVLKGVELTAFVAEKALAGLRLALGTALNLFDAFVKNVLQKFLDFKVCGFKNTLSVAVGWEIEMYCEVNFLNRGWKKHHFVINFRNIIGSLWKLAKDFIQQIGKSGATGRRGRRDTEYDALSSFHKIYRRSVDNLEDNATNDTWAFNSGNFWVDQCKIYTGSIEFITDSLARLLNISTTAQHAAESLESNSAEIHNEIDWETEINLAKAEQPHVDEIYEEYNLTREQVETAIADMNFTEDEEFREMNATLSEMKTSNTEGLRSMIDTDIVQMWITDMENRTEESTFSDDECDSLADCFVYAFGELYSVLDSVEPNLVKTAKSLLPYLEERAYALFDNDSRSAAELVEITKELSHKLRSLEIDDVFCGSLPVVDEGPSSKTVLIGGSVVLSCTAHGVPEPKFYWLKDDVTVDGATSSFITLTNVTPDESGLYNCVAGNHMGNTSSLSAKVEVVYPPTIHTELPEKVEVLVGENKTLECNSSANPVGQITWYTSISKTPISHDRDLLIHGVSEAAFLVKCVVNNSYGTAASDEVLVRVQTAAPAYPVVDLRLGYIRRPLGNVSGSLLGLEQGEKDFSDMFSSVIQSIMQNASESVLFTVVGVNTSAYTLDVTISHRTHDESHCNHETCKQRHRQMYTDVYQNIKLLMNHATGERILFSSDGFGVYFDPSTVYLNGEKQLCREGVEIPGSLACATVPELRLDPPRNLQHTIQDGTMVFEWKPPVYGIFIAGYKLDLLNTADGSVRVFKTPASETSLMVNATLQPGQYRARVSAYTQSHDSSEANTTVQFEVNPPGASEQVDPSTAGVVVGVSVTVGVIAIALAVVGVVLYSSKSQKTGSISSFGSTMSTSAGSSDSSSQGVTSRSTTKSVQAWQPIVAGDQIVRNRRTSLEMAQI